jgi:hypothetical protein
MRVMPMFEAAEEPDDNRRSWRHMFGDLEILHVLGAQ